MHFFSSSYCVGKNRLYVFWRYKLKRMFVDCASHSLLGVCTVQWRWHLFFYFFVTVISADWLDYENVIVVYHENYSASLPELTCTSPTEWAIPCYYCCNGHGTPGYIDRAGCRGRVIKVNRPCTSVMAVSAILRPGHYIQVSHMGDDLCMYGQLTILGCTWIHPNNITNTMPGHGRWSLDLVMELG